jgi:transcriptional regulator with XRE-family HTH domain
MKNITGFLIRRHRLQNNLSQEDLCRGICAVSYLSKIEQGLAVPSEEMISQLFAALGITYTLDAGFLQKGKTLLHRYFDRMLFDEDISDEAAALSAAADSFFYSPLCVGYLLFQASYAVQGRQEGQLEEILAQLAPFLSDLEREELACYNWLISCSGRPITERIAAARQACTLHPCYLFLHQLAMSLYQQGDYHEAIREATRGFFLAAEAGNAVYMLDYTLIIATSYANLYHFELMMQYYRQAASLARTVRPTIRQTIVYNIGATLIETQHDQEGILYLLEAYELAENSIDRLLACHKLALAYEQIGHPEQGISYLKEAQALLEQEQLDPMFHQMIRLVAMRYQPGYLDRPEYLSLLQEIYGQIGENFAFGYQQFHAHLLIEAYTHHRRYKEALAISQQMRNISQDFKRFDL